jgi:hypothetical protein
MSNRFFVCLPLLFCLSVVCLSGCEKSSNQLAAAGFSVTGSPSLSAAFIDQVLAANNSPAIGTGQVFYEQSVSTGIDDAYALAFFQHESTFGKYGVAASSLSIGNLRCLGDDYSDLGTWCESGYAYFPSWSNGIIAWYRLIHNLYVTEWRLTNVDQVVSKYAPADDSNDPSSYVQSVEASVSLWRSGRVA